MVAAVHAEVVEVQGVLAAIAAAAAVPGIKSYPTVTRSAVLWWQGWTGELFMPFQPSSEEAAAEIAVLLEGVIDSCSKQDRRPSSSSSSSSSNGSRVGGWAPSDSESDSEPKAQTLYA
jgi:hypothetical protein